MQEGSVDGAPGGGGVGGGGRISAEIRGGLPRHLKSVPSLFPNPFHIHLKSCMQLAIKAVKYLC